MTPPTDNGKMGKKPSQIIKQRAKELGSEVIETIDGRKIILGWQAGMEALLEYLDEKNVGVYL